LRINPPKFGGGLKFEPVDKSRLSGTPELGKRGRFANVSGYAGKFYRQDKRNNQKKGDSFESPYEKVVEKG